MLIRQAAQGLHGGEQRVQVPPGLAPEAGEQRVALDLFDHLAPIETFTALFNLQVVLRVGGTAISDGDIVSPTADLSLLLISPAPLDPEADLTLVIGGNPVDFVATPANGDGSGREWLLTWTHSPYPSADYVLQPVTSEEMAVLEPCVERAVDALECLVHRGVAVAMNQFNVRERAEEDEPKG